MSRIKQLQNELAVARAQIKDLTTENRVLKMMERRQGEALAKYEGAQARMPRVIKSYTEEIRSLETQLRQVKDSYRNLDISHRAQTAELQVVQNQLKRLVDLTKNKQLADRETLSKRLEEAETTMKLQEEKIRNLLKQIELKDKNYQIRVDTEIKKNKILRTDLMKTKEANKTLELNMNKLKSQSYTGRQNCSWGANLGVPTNADAQSMSSFLNEIRHNNRGDHNKAALSDSPKQSLKPELANGAFNDINIEHTKDLKKNSIRNLKKNFINKPYVSMNIYSSSSDSSDTKSMLNH